MVTMVPGSRYVCSTHSTDEDPGNDREERILAVLGIIGTVLNLLVVIFVYIYTTPEERFLALLGIIGIFLNLLLLLFVYIYTASHCLDMTSVTSTGQSAPSCSVLTL